MLVINNFIIIIKNYYNLRDENDKCDFRIIVKNNIFEIIDYEIKNDFINVFNLIFANFEINIQFVFRKKTFFTFLTRFKFY